MPLTGNCNCGAIQVTIEDKGLHGTYVMLVDDGDFKVEGTPKGYLDTKTDSGTSLYRYFCGDCGSPIISVTPLVPGKSFVKMGLFEKIPNPVIEVYTKNRQEWEPPIPGTKQVEGAT